MITELESPWPERRPVIMMMVPQSLTLRPFAIGFFEKLTKNSKSVENSISLTQRTSYNDSREVCYLKRWRIKNLKNSQKVWIIFGAGGAGWRTGNACTTPLP